MQFWCSAHACGRFQNILIRKHLFPYKYYNQPDCFVPAIAATYILLPLPEYLYVLLYHLYLSEFIYFSNLILILIVNPVQKFVKHYFLFM